MITISYSDIYCYSKTSVFIENQQFYFNVFLYSYQIK